MDNFFNQKKIEEKRAYELEKRVILSNIKKNKQMIEFSQKNLKSTLPTLSFLNSEINSLKSIEKKDFFP